MLQSVEESGYEKRELKRFTLIELLVVIAIIAILASVLMPALNKAREKGRTIKCMSNLKQISTGLTLYLDDYSGYFPVYSQFAFSPADANVPYWNQNLVKHKYVNHSIFNCPTFSYSSRTFDADKVIDWRYTHYGINFRHIAGGYRYNGKITSATAKISRIKKPSLTLVTADTYLASRPDRGYVCLGDRPADDYVVHARHSDNINVVWADGHASSVKGKLGYVNYNYSNAVLGQAGGDFSGHPGDTNENSKWDRY